MRPSLLVGFCASAALLLGAASAGATPQANAALTAGVAGVGDRSDLWAATRLSSGLRADVLFLRERDVDLGIGPYVEGLTTTSFHDLTLGGGGSVLVPVHPYLPIVLSAGPYARKTEAFGWEPGVAGALFWGSRSFNYHSLYGLAGGLLVEARYGLGDSHEVTMVIGAQLDFAFVAMPFMFAYDAIAHL